MAADYFLQIEGIEGESKDAQLKLDGLPRPIELQSWSWGQTQSGRAAEGPGGGEGTVTPDSFRFTKKLDGSGHKLAEHCSAGRHIKKARFTARRVDHDDPQGSPVDYIRVDFGELIIDSYQIVGDVVPVEQISFKFSTLQMIYKELVKGVAQGGVPKGYDYERKTMA